MKRVSTSARSVLVVLVVALFSLTLAAPAGAAVGPGGAVIVCTYKFNNPHGSTHVGGTVNSSVDTSCTAPVSVITSFISLHDLTNGRTNPTGGTKTYGSRTNYGNSALSCVPGTYQATGVVQVTFPPGYTPNFTSGEGSSRAVSIACNGASRVAPTDEGLSAANGTEVETFADGSFSITITATKD